MGDGALDDTTNLEDEAGGHLANARHRAQRVVHELPSAREVEEKAAGRATTALRAAETAPDSAYLGVMAASMALSLILLGRGNKTMALFVGLWPVTILNLAMMLKDRRPSRELQQVTPVSSGADGLLLAE
jgi:hypothetical protein